jgi:hypothetical protein
VRELALPRHGVEAHDTARRGDGDDSGHAELGRLLHHDVHALSARDTLDQGDGERRLRARRAARLDLHLERPAPESGDARGIVVPVAVEERERVAGLEPQHAPCMGGRGSRDRDARALGERGLYVHADQAHAASTAPAATPASHSSSSGAMT